MATRIPPPKPGTPVPKEYVRQQLNTLGIKNVTEEDLEAYAADLTELIKGTLGCKDCVPPDVNWRASPGASISGGGPSYITGGASVGTSQGAGVRAMRPAMGLTLSPPPLDTMNPPPHLNHSSPEGAYQLSGQGSAVFKTFPGDKENRVQLLSPSLSPTPVRRSSAGWRGGEHSPRARSASPLSSTLSSASRETARRRHEPVVKRRVLRKCNGESRVFDESVSGLESDAGKRLARYLSDLSLTSVSSTNVSSQLPGSAKHRVHCCKSFIRPPTSHPHTRGLKKNDPVNRYHHFKQLWANFKPPGERARNSLRWSIREQLMHQDVPYYQPQRRVYQPNQFVVPTDKKRSSLRWEVRHALAHQ